MGFKRKRSVDESPLSVNSFASWASPERNSPTPFLGEFATSTHIDAPMSRGIGWDFDILSRVKSGADSGRTRKRHRDNRPDEQIIHETTISKLFSAQRNAQPEPIPSDTLATQLPTSAPQKPQKSTLHSFWKISAQPVQCPSIHTHDAHHANIPHCEDCDALLERDANDMDMDMDIDGPTEGSFFACSDCGRNVCGKCAVVSDTRHCLQCATSATRRWW